MASHKILDPRARPPLIIQETYKSYQKKRDWSTYRDETIVDFSKPNSRSAALKIVAVLDKQTLQEACLSIEDESEDEYIKPQLAASISDRPVYQHPDLPGR